jgi:hypothetical protein
VGDLLTFAALVAAVAVAGIWLGMLVAPRIARLTEPHEEDDGADED